MQRHTQAAQEQSRKLLSVNRFVSHPCFQGSGFRRASSKMTLLGQSLTSSARREDREVIACPVGSTTRERERRRRLILLLDAHSTSPCSWAICLFAYQSLDSIDGKQARRTGMAGPLGELFDHGCDALNTTVSAFFSSLKPLPNSKQTRPCCSSNACCAPRLST